METSVSLTGLFRVWRALTSPSRCCAAWWATSRWVSPTPAMWPWPASCWTPSPWSAWTPASATTSETWLTRPGMDRLQEEVGGCGSGIFVCVLVSKCHLRSAALKKKLAISVFLLFLSRFVGRLSGGVCVVLVTQNDSQRQCDATLKFFHCHNGWAIKCSGGRNTSFTITRCLRRPGHNRDWWQIYLRFGYWHNAGNSED